MGRKRRGVLWMEKIKEILRLAEAGVSKTAIAESCNVSRQTVRDYITRAAAAGVGANELEGLNEERCRGVFEKKQGGRRIKDGELDFEYVSRELTRPGVTLLVLWEEYLRERPEGYSYSQFCSRYRVWSKEKKLVLRQEYRAGEKSLADYAGQKLQLHLDGRDEALEVPIFVGVLGASDLVYAEATLDEKTLSWIGALSRMYEYFGGVTQALVIDNATACVDSAMWYEPGINRAFSEFAEHYTVAVLPTRVRKPRDKGKAEEAVRLVEERILARLRNEHFTSLSQMNAAIRVLLEELNQRRMQAYGVSRRELFEQTERSHLKPLPALPFVIARWENVKANIDYHVVVDGHYYSVPNELVGRELQARVTEKTVEVFEQKRCVVAHLRSRERGKRTTIVEHMPHEHRYLSEWTPTRMLHWASNIGEQTKLQSETLLSSKAHPEQAYRAILGIIRLSKRYGAERVEAACARANAHGLASYRSIEAILRNGSDLTPCPEQEELKPVLHENLRGSRYYH